MYEPSSDLSQKRKSGRDLENERIRILLERQTEQILAGVRSEIQEHELQAESDKRSIQELTGVIDSQRMEIEHTITGCDQSRRDQLLLQEELSEQNRALRETRITNMRDMAEKSRVKGRGTFSRKLTEDQNTIMEPRAKIQELQYAVDHPTFPVIQRYFHLIVIQEDCQAAAFSRQIFGIRRYIGKRFC